MDALLVWVVTGRLWTPLAYVHPSLAAREAATGVPPQWVFWVLVLWSLPFYWIGISMTVRRTVHAGLAAGWSLLFFVPIVNYLYMILLCFLPASETPPAPPPSRPRRVDRGRVQHRGRCAGRPRDDGIERGLATRLRRIAVPRHAFRHGIRRCVPSKSGGAPQRPRDARGRLPDPRGRRRADRPAGARGARVPAHGAAARSAARLPRRRAGASDRARRPSCGRRHELARRAPPPDGLRGSRASRARCAKWRRSSKSTRLPNRSGRT